MPIQLIAMDIDGTLLDSQSKLSADNAETIAEAAARGVEIVIVTGRRFHSAKLIAEQIPCNVELITSNGALVKSKNGETHLRTLLPVETARRVLDATEEFRQLSGVIFDRPAENQVIFERIDWDGPFVGPYLRRHKTQVAEVAPLANCLNGEDPVEVMFIGECAPVSAARARLESQDFRDDFTIAITEYPRTGFSFMDVLGRGVTKGSALEAWARRKGISRENVMAIGDNWNDREMLEYAGLPVVMGNSIAGLKSLGWATTLTNDQSGVAEAIRQHALRNAD